MLLDVSKAFLAPGTAFPFEAKVTLPPQDVTGETVTFDEALLRGEYTLHEDAVHLKGTLTGAAHGTCALCLGPAAVPLRVSFAEVFRKNAEGREDESFPFEGKSVPLDQMALTLMMLNLPMRFVCRKDCAGTQELQAWQRDHSKSSCEDGSPTQRPFEALQRLLKKDEEV